MKQNILSFTDSRKYLRSRTQKRDTLTVISLTKLDYLDLNVFNMDHFVNLDVPLSSSDSVSSSSHSHAALLNEVVLKSVFKNLDLISLKKCREVCKLWSSIAKPLLHPRSVVYLRDLSFDDEEKPPKTTVQYRLMELKDAQTFAIPGGINYKIGRMGPLRAPVLDKIKGEVKSLNLVALNHNEEERLKGSQFTEIGFPLLKSLSLEHREYGKNDMNVGKNIPLVLDIIRRSPNLQELSFTVYDTPERSADFFRSILHAEALPANENLKLTLKSLRMKSYFNFNNEAFEALRSMKLELETLVLKIDFNSFENCPALCLWLEELGPSLRSLSLGFRVFWVDRKLIKLQMKMMTSLKINSPGSLGVDDLIELLKGLPNLETLTLVWTDIKQPEFLQGKELSFPKLRNLTISGWFNTQPSRYKCIPSLFPNLRTLGMVVHSKSDLLECIYSLKDMEIEELELNLSSLPKEFETDRIPPSGWSLSSWKKLRKLTLNYTNYNSLTKVYGMDLEDILSPSLTSLRITNSIKASANSLIELLRGLPVLLQLDLYERHCGVCIVEEDGSLMERSVFMEKVEQEREIHPFLLVYKRRGLFKEVDGMSDEEFEKEYNY